MAARSKARKRALDVLYEADIRGVPAADVLAVHEREASSPYNPYVAELVAGVGERSARIDDLISTYAQAWTIERMPVVDRNILRIGVWELLYTEAPEAVVMSEAVTLATSLSTDQSGPFVNGVLARIAQVKPRLALD